MENLLSNEDFFAETFGVILNEIGKHYQMAKLSHVDLENIRRRLLPLRLIEGTLCRERVYMQCFPKHREIRITRDVGVFFILEKRRSLSVAH